MPSDSENHQTQETTEPEASSNPTASSPRPPGSLPDESDATHSERHTPRPRLRDKDVNEIGAGTNGIVYLFNTQNLGEIPTLLEDYEDRRKRRPEEFNSKTEYILVDKLDLETMIKLQKSVC